MSSYSKHSNPDPAREGEVAVLCEQGVMSIHGVGGKRAMRVYPPWDTTTSRQAQKTQAW